MAGDRVMWLVMHDHNMVSYCADTKETAWRHAEIDQKACQGLLIPAGWRCSRIVVEGEGE